MTRGRWRRATGAGLLVIAVAAAAGGTWKLLSPPAARPEAGGAGDALAALAAPAAGFERALAPRRFEFPADHGPHPGFRTEWWYYTGHLASDSGRRFGFQLTVFRFALAPRAPRRESRWAAHQAYLGHLAITDVDAGRFHTARRLSRAALDLAGATRDPVRVWLGDWSITRLARAGHAFELRASGDGLGLALEVDSRREPVANGEAGLSRKGPQPGNASYYYSLTRMSARGELRIEGETIAVGGDAWMDREWSTSALAPELAGWDWFSLQLSDGRDLMFYRLRRHDGDRDRFSAGTLVAADGTPASLAWDAVRVHETATWTSPEGGHRYPAAWRLEIPGQGLNLSLRPLVADQEWKGMFRYYEGAVEVSGHGPAGALSGLGYVELTGYADGTQGRR